MDTGLNSPIKQETMLIKNELECIENVSIPLEAMEEGKCLKKEPYADVNVKIEPVSMEAETKTAFDVQVKTEIVCVKEEPNWMETEWEESEESPQAALYADHDVKPDLVIGTESLQPKDAAFNIASSRAKSNASEKVRLKKSSVPRCKEARKVCRKFPKPGTAQNALGNILGAKKTKPLLCNETKFICDLCDKVFNSKQRLVSHMNGHTYNNRYFCFFCKKNFTTQAYADIHRRKHTGDMPYSCDVCQKRYVNATTLRKHKRIHSGKKRFSCDVCHKQFREKSQLTIHSLIHQGEAGKKYTCQYCQKKFMHRYKLAIHERSHTGDKPFQCAVCSKGYTQKFSLQMHLRLHFGEFESARRCSCKTCGLTFSTEYELERHEKNNPSLSCLKFSCSVCKKMFKGKRDLNRHEITHTGVRPYSCDECGKAFNQRAHLTGHKLVHTGQKPFACTLCEMRFVGKGGLNKHMQRIHANGGTRSLVCKICAKEFTRACSFALHEKWHNRATPENKHKNMTQSVCI